MSPILKEVFESIYHSHSWGGKSRSGPGSDKKNTFSYIQFVNHWLERHPECKSIVELGCGDWATTGLINLSPRHSYFGQDIVPSLISSNQKLYQSGSIHFECFDFLSQAPPCADLLLIKDVLQHLSNDGVHAFLRDILPRYRYAIITNDIHKYEKWRCLGIFTLKRELQKPNIDIPDGKSRPLRLDKTPFRIKVTHRSIYSIVLELKPRSVIFVKEILVWSQNQ